MPIKSPLSVTPVGAIINPAQLFAVNIMAMPNTFKRMPINIWRDFLSLRINSPAPIGSISKRAINALVSPLM